MNCAAKERVDADVSVVLPDGRLIPEIRVCVVAKRAAPHLEDKRSELGLDDDEVRLVLNRPTAGIRKQPRDVVKNCELIRYLVAELPVEAYLGAAVAGLNSGRDHPCHVGS